MELPCCEELKQVGSESNFHGKKAIDGSSCQLAFDGSVVVYFDFQGEAIGLVFEQLGSEDEALNWKIVFWKTNFNFDDCLEVTTERDFYFSLEFIKQRIASLNPADFLSSHYS